ncbi:Glycerophosphoryl diester phosphodiesterase [hydrothermal vent metagenome]|uniref:Glycerophosphoryl diester phosphodiesterase n=1 Tax=hydrothermal vent metagenome TaxID=652676 RepID=A0A3B0QSG0_9ZZZZ
MKLKQIITFGIFIILTSCNSPRSIDVQGHRGCRGLFPENSLPAFEKAIDLGVNTLELDLAISKDRKVVVSHEPYINKLFCLNTLGEEITLEEEKVYNLFKMNYQQIKAFDCGTKQYTRFPDQQKIKTYKPLLSEVFDLAKEKNSNVKFNIEIKADPKYDNIYTPEPKEFVRLVLNLIKQYGVFESTNLQSFDIRILEEIKKQAPKMRLSLLVDENETIEDKLSKLSFIPEIISPYFGLLDAKTITVYQSKEIQIIPWTVNSEEDMQLMIDYQVDGIITDYPNKLIEMLKK